MKPVTVEDCRSPVAIGGVGGSGTRLIARIISELGYDIGSDLNGPLDNLHFTLLFKYREALTIGDRHFASLYELFRSRLSNTGAPSQIDADLAHWLLNQDRTKQSEGDKEWLEARIASFNAATVDRAPSKLFGWKEPNTHLVLDRIAPLEPKLRYIHVTRNGLDMAFSQNRNQFNLWGNMIFNREIEWSPRNALSYWRWAHENVMRIGHGMDDRFLMINYDAFCASPEIGLQILLRFLGHHATPARIDRLKSFVEIQESMGRYRHHDLNDFEPEDVAFVRSLGFRVDGKDRLVGKGQNVRSASVAIAPVAARASRALELTA